MQLILCAIYAIRIPWHARPPLWATSYAQNQYASKGIWTKIEATELDRWMLLENLNTHDQDHYMRFELAESDYDYRIVFSTAQGTTQFHVRIPLRHK